MKQFIKELFSAGTDSLSYKKIIVDFLLGIIVPLALIICVNFIPVGSPFRFVILIPTIMVIYMILLFFCRLIWVSDNREKNDVKSNKYKYKHTPVKVSVQDFILLLNKAKMPEIIYTKSLLDINYIFEISFETKGKYGPFFNKKFFLDGKDLKDCNQCIHTLEELKIIKEGYIDVYETFDHNKPEMLLKIIQELKISK